MMKRTLSLLLALVMVLGLLPGTMVGAAGVVDEIYIDESTDLSELADSGLIDIITEETDELEEPFLEEPEYIEPELDQPVFEDSDIFEVPMDSELPEEETFPIIPEKPITDLPPSQSFEEGIAADEPEEDIDSAVAEEIMEQGSLELPQYRDELNVNSSGTVSQEEGTTNDTVNQVEWIANDTGEGVVGTSDVITYNTTTGGASIRILPHPDLAATATKLHINLKQLLASGVEVTVYLDESFSNYPLLTEVVIHATAADKHLMYTINGGGLILRGLPGCRLVLDGADVSGNLVFGNTTETQLINFRNTTQLLAQYVTFRNAPRRAVRGLGGRVESVSLSYCVFEDTCTTSPYNEDNNTAPDGGAICFYPYSGKVAERSYTVVRSFSVDHCQFQGNTAGRHGGAVCLYGTFDQASITNCSFTGTATLTASSSMYGGAVSLNGLINKVVISGSTFTGCTSAGNGGAIGSTAAIGEFTVENCTFDSCSSASMGGALFVTTVKLGANSTHFIGAEGGPYSRVNTLNINGSTFTNCQATSGRGGAVSLRAQIGAVNIGSGTGFTGCSASGGSYTGGALAFDQLEVASIASAGWIDASWTTLFWEDAQPYGAARDTIITSSDGKFRTSMGNVTVDNVTVTACSAYQGGGLQIRTDTVIDSFALTNSAITGCVTSGNSGGGLHWGSSGVSNITVSNTQISGNTSAGSGGGAYILTTAGSTVSFDNVDIFGNKGGSDGTGGGVTILSNGTTDITVSNCDIYNNESGSGGGGLCLSSADNDGDICITNSNFYGNSSGSSGGGLWISSMSESVTVTDSRFYGNAAGSYQNQQDCFGNGGGIYLTGDGAVAAISGCTIGVQDSTQTGNSANAVWVPRRDSDGNLVLGSNNAVVYDINGGTGGGLAVFGADVTVTDTTIRGNQTNYLGGGVGYRDGSHIVLSGVTLEDNYATLGGGVAVSTSRGDSDAQQQADRYGLYIIDSTLRNNRATPHAYPDPDGNTVNTNPCGGGLYISRADVGLENVLIDGNAACRQADGQEVMEDEMRGGGIAVHYESVLDVFGGVVSNNRAYYGGGIEINAGSSVTLHPDSDDQAVQITGNTSQNGGGGVHVASKDDGNRVNALVVNGGEFSYNQTMGGNGAAIAVYQYGSVTVTGVEIHHNTAQLRLTGNWTTDDDGNSVPEEAYGYGGGIYCYRAAATVIGCNVHDNSAGRRGGGMYSEYGSSIYVKSLLNEDGSVKTRSIIRNNYARDYGGGVGAVGYLDAGISATLTLEGTLVEKNTALGGAGVYISSRGVCSMDANTTVQENKSDRSGGGILANILADVELNGATVTRNEAGSSGGGVYVNAGSSVKITEGTISYNKAGNNGGGVLAGASMEYKGSKVTITGGEIVYNEAGSDGAGVYAGGTIPESYEGDIRQWSSLVEIGGGTICDNHAGQNGGGVYVTQYSEVTISDGVITDNIADAQGGGVMGMVNSIVTLNGGQILTNHAGTGGGISVGGNSQVFVQNGKIEGNIAQAVPAKNSAGQYDTTEYGYGGGIYATSNASITVTGGEIKQNYAKECIYWVDEDNNVYYEETEGATKIDKASGLGGGIHIRVTAQFIMDRSESGDTGSIINNVADTNGGGVYAQGSHRENDGVNVGCHPTVTINGGTISGNKTVNGNGGGIYAIGTLAYKEDSGAVVTVNGGLISENEAVAVQDSYGGGVYTTNYASLTVNGGTIRKNTATRGGGACANNCSAITLNGGLVEENQATAGGGVYVTTLSQVTMNQSKDGDSCQIKGNTASVHGGGVYALNASLATINVGQIINNTARSNGGGIYASGGADGGATVVVNGGTIADNEAGSGYGGGVFTTRLSSVTIDGGSVLRNKATKLGGGGIYSTDGSSVSVQHGTVSYNSAAYGGGIFVTGTLDQNGATVSVTGGTIDHNTATVDGGGIYGSAPDDYDTSLTYRSARITIGGGSLEYNTSDRNGGGIFATRCVEITISEGTIHHNKAVTNGGGMMMNYESKLQLQGGSVYENEARYGGGIVITTDSEAYISGGKVTKNTAQSYGGGIYVNNNGVLTVQQGEIIENNASIYGGGVFISTGSGYGSTVTLSGGTISQNTAASGGGIAAYASGVNTTVLTVEAGSITDNTATYGGGIIATGTSEENDNGTTTRFGIQMFINGGVISGNTAQHGNGGGLSISQGTVLEISDGTIYKNQAVRNTDSTEASGYGGGLICSGITQVTINGGSITENTAYLGGGLYATGGANANVTVSGGTISANRAARGAGLYVTSSTNVTCQGGLITRNIANGNGGGIYVGSSDTSSTPTVMITEDTTHNTVGVITENTAYNGGGIFVANQGSLTVEGGHITNNNAIVPNGVSSLSTGYKKNDGLYGAGGGICVVNGNADTSARFMLTGEDMAIYGNKAEFSGDDVFSNGNNTTLTIPLVSEMNLEGFEFNALGWFEDYNANDTSYGSGLNMLSFHDRTDLPVKRYRSYMATERQLIEEDYVKGTGNAANAWYVNKPNAYVAMTLGIPAAVHDTVVVDYGLGVVIDLLQNDMLDTEEDLTNKSTLGKEIPAGITESNEIFYTMSTQVADGFARDLTAAEDTCIELSSGKANWTADGQLHYVMTDMNLDHNEVFWYAVTDSKCSYYAKVSIVPATTIYFEDNCDCITYGSSTEASAWTEVGEKIKDKLQGQDRPGVSVREDMDADNIYGYDGSYTETADYSMGSAMMTTVSKGNSATADFTFTGTGFDIISRSDSNTGLITATIYRGKPEAGQQVTDLEQVETLMVDSWYESEGTLYQVPLLKKSGLDYGTYTVRIRAAYGSWADHGQNSGGKSWNFYLDAIRIYDPVGNGGINQQIQDAYLQDNECWPAYQELRDMFLTQNELTPEAATGAIFIDGNDEPTIKAYRKYGPNNEIYLSEGESISFTLNALHYTGSFAAEAFSNELVAAIHIGMRGLGGKGSVTVSGDESIRNMELSTTDLYYDITEMMNQTVTIANTGDTPISITTVKVTHNSEPGADVDTNNLITMDSGTAELALERVKAIYASQRPVLTPRYPSLSFEGMICYNIFFGAENLGSLTGADLGLAVFDSEDTDGTVDTAMDVIYGAVEADGMYKVTTNGIPAKNMGDTLYFKVFAKQADGSYVYSSMVSYNAVKYAKNILAGTNEAMKAPVVAMLNYGAQAQTFFGYRTDALMNKDLTAEDQALLENVDISVMNPVGKADPAKTAAFTSNGGFIKKYPSVSFEGAFVLNYYFQPAKAPEGDLTLYIWNEDTYNAVSALTAENADKRVTMTLADGLYTGSSDWIVAKNLDETLYVAAVYEADGTTWCSGVLPYSVVEYCSSAPADTQSLADAAAVYGCSVKALLDPQ